LALAWLVCLGGWIGVSLIPDRYQSSTRIYADADVVLSQLLNGIAIDSAPASQVELLQRTLLSRPNLARIIARTDLDMRVTSTASREALLGSLERDIRIAAQTRNLFTISYTDTDARITRDVVQALVTLFIELASTTDRQQMENARNFVGQQIAAYEQQLREAERRRADFRVRYMELLPSDALGGITRLEQARAQVQQLSGTLADARQRRDLIRQQLDGTPQTLSVAELAATKGNGAAADPRITALEAQLNDLRLRLTEKHPDILSAVAMLAELKKQAAAKPATNLTNDVDAANGGRNGSGPRIANPIYEQLKLRVIDADAAIGSLERQLREEQAQADKLQALARGAPQLQAEFENLDRDYNILRRNYEDLLSRRESLQIAGAARTGAERVRLEVVDPPTVPLAPISPNRVFLSTVVLLAGLAAGGALAALLILLDRGFYTLNDARRLGLPVLGSISAADPPARMTIAALAFGSGLALLLLAFGAVVVGGQSLIARVPGLVARMVA
jgi:polysaccharide chain length determinant protein (PEP-CTERM system associated)